MIEFLNSLDKGLVDRAVDRHARLKKTHVGGRSHGRLAQLSEI